MKSKASITWLNRIEMVGFRLTVALMRPFSPRNRSNIAGWGGRNIGALLPAVQRAQSALRELRPQMNAAERRTLIRRMLDNFARTAVEYEALPALFADAPKWPIDGAEHLKAAHEKGRGFIIASAHYGNWEAIRAAAAHHGAPMAIIYRAFNNRLIDEVWYDYITSTGAPAFRKGSKGARELFKHVRGGGGAIILVDQRQGGGPLLNFLGKQAETSTSAAQLAKTLRAPLLTARARRTEDGFDVRFEPEIEPEDPDLMMQKVNDRIAVWVDEAPEQWFWLHRRWKIRSTGRRSRKYEARSSDG